MVACSGMASSRLSPTKASAATLSTNIQGSGADVVKIAMKPGEVILADPGTLVYMEDGITMKILPRGGRTRFIAGGRLFVQEYINTKNDSTATLVLGTEFPSQVVPLKLEDHGGKLLGQVHSFLCSSDSVELDVIVDFVRLTPFVLETISGTGSVLLNGSGNILDKNLKEGEIIRVATGALVAFEKSVTYKNVVVSGGVLNAVFGGQGFFLTELRGPGTVWLDSAPISGIVKEISRRLPKD